MQNQKRVDMIRHVLILTALVGLVLISWLLGHILRYSIPSLWHPPIRETDPQIRYGVEFDGIRRLVVLTGTVPAKEHLEIYIPDLQRLSLPGGCLGHTFFTSLPAKCRTADGHLVKVGGVESNVVVIPQGK